MLLLLQIFSYTGVESISRRLRATVGVFWGRYGLPLPLKADLIIAMGAPIAVDKVNCSPILERIGKSQGKRTAAAE